MELVDRLGIDGRSGPAGMAAAAELYSEGLWAHERIISRNERARFPPERPKARAKEQRPIRQFDLTRCGCSLIGACVFSSGFLSPGEKKDPESNRN